MPDDKKKAFEILKKWPKFTPAIRRKKEKEKFRMELKALNKLVARLPEGLKKEMKSIWLDYERGLSKEGRFVKQADKITNFLQGMDYYKRYGKIQHLLWSRWIKEIIDDPILIEFIREVENKYYKAKK